MLTIRRGAEGVGLGGGGLDSARIRQSEAVCYNSFASQVEMA